MTKIFITISISFFSIYQCYRYSSWTTWIPPIITLIKSYFFKSAIILLISGLANVMAYLVFKTTTSISIASVAVLLGWFICTEWYFVRKYNLKYKKTLTYILIMMFTFYEITAIDGGLVGLVLYVLAFTLLSAAFFSKDIRQLIGLIK